MNQPVAEGETGEVCIRGSILMKGYWNKPEATAEAIDADGWLHTGDIGHLDDEGYLAITDRKKDMIIRGGENIYCVEIENRLVLHPAIADAAIIGVPHPELGEEVKAVVQVEPGQTLTEGDVRTWVRSRAGRLQGARARRDPEPGHCLAMPRGSCSRTSCGARARSASPKPCESALLVVSRPVPRTGRAGGTTAWMAAAARDSGTRR